MLEQLAGLTERAQQILEAEQRADEDNGSEEGDEIEGDLSLSIELETIIGCVTIACGQTR